MDWEKIFANHVTYKGLIFKIYKQLWDFPGGPVIKNPHFHGRGKGSIPGRGTKIPQAVCCGQKTKENIQTAHTTQQQQQKTTQLKNVQKTGVPQWPSG